MERVTVKKIYSPSYSPIIRIIMSTIRRRRMPDEIQYKTCRAHIQQVGSFFFSFPVFYANRMTVMASLLTSRNRAPCLTWHRYFHPGGLQLCSVVHRRMIVAVSVCVYGADLVRLWDSAYHLMVGKASGNSLIVGCVFNSLGWVTGPLKYPSDGYALRPTNARLDLCWTKVVAIPSVRSLQVASQTRFRQLATSAAREVGLPSP